MEEVYFSLGTNLGNREENIREAVSRMEAVFSCPAVAISDLLETEPWGFSSDCKFLNCAVRFDLDIHPEEVLSIVKGIEESMGRDVRNVLFDSSGNRIYQSRVIDIDILLYGKMRYDSERLHIPHLLMSERDFVMVPLRQIVSDRLLSSFHDIFER